MTVTGTLAALSWDPEVKGALYVLISVVVLCGSSYLLLSTNVGGRLGFQLAAAGLFGWLAVLGLVWWVYGRGPVGPSPAWEPKRTITGDLAQARGLEVLERFPRGWKKLDLEDPEVADAQAVVDGVLVPPPDSGRKGRFESTNDYLPIQAREKGGEDYGPLGLNFRPFDVFHTPHYLAIQVQKSMRPPAAPGQPPPRAVPDPSAQPVTVVMERNLGALRLRPAVFTLFSTAMFALLCWSLHARDKEAWARQAQPQPT